MGGDMHSETILIVEDNSNWRDLLQDLLKPDYEIEGVSNVQEAEDKLKSRRFGLVITNLQLGSLAGIADQLGLVVIEMLQESAPGTPCIVLTGSAQEQREQVQNFCNTRYNAHIWVMGKGIENLYAELRSKVGGVFRANA
jgi:DNA-binding NtrC family response regulator